MEAWKVVDRFKDSREKYCQTCDTKRFKSKKITTCVECHNEFEASEYWFAMKRTEFPKKC